LVVWVDAHRNVAAEIARLRAAVGREAAAIDRTLNGHPSCSADGYPRWGRDEYAELSRQLEALRAHVARAPSRSRDQADLRAEFATLLPFAKTLRADAQTWRAALDDGLVELDRQEAAAQAERERLAAERAVLAQRRDALQSTLDQTAVRIARENGGELRNTLPVFTLADALTICSVAVLSPRRWFRSRPDWLVTLDDARDRVRIQRGY
jgi:hypothetical protein